MLLNFVNLQNSIRHNLSLYDMFVRVKSSCGERVNVSYWTLSSSNTVDALKPRSTSKGNKNFQTGCVVSCCVY